MSEGRTEGRNNKQQVRDATLILQTEKQIMAVKLLSLCPLVLFFLSCKSKNGTLFSECSPVTRCILLLESRQPSPTGPAMTVALLR